LQRLTIQSPLCYSKSISKSLLENPLSFLTLLTDFGIEDGYVASMKGVIWQLSPDTQITDITHAIPPQDVFTGSYLLARTANYFPQGTVHVGVVDPGVGTARRPIAARIGDQYFVGPDNGLITFLVKQAQTSWQSCHFIHLNHPEYWLPNVSRVFHGRDIFAPVGAHLCRGVPLNELGDSIDNPVLLDIKDATYSNTNILGAILQIDHFGNLTTNIHESLFNGKFVDKIIYKEIDFGELAQSFGEKKPGEWVALIDSYAHLSLSLVKGNAASTLNARVGDQVNVVFKKINL
jgi:S-adenosylmethionine hydrolase